MPDKELSRKVISELIKADGRDDVEIAEDLGISSQRLGQYKNGKRYPNVDFVSKWKEVFGQDLAELIKKSETNVSHETKKHTSVVNRKGIDPATRAEVYRDILENYTEYIMIPRFMLESHRFTSLEQMQKDKELINGLMEKNDQLTAKVLQLQAQLPATQKT